MNKALLIIFLFCTFTMKGQNKNNYKIGIIPNISYFEKMTQNEIRIDSLKDKYNLEKLALMKEGKTFLSNTPDEYVKNQIELQKLKINSHYKDNRSRYILASYKNEEIERMTLKKDTLTTECDCFLDNDTIKVKMGMWIFGGFSFNLNLYDGKFSGTYWEDAHKKLIYKKSLSENKLTDNILLTFKEQFLILKTKPKYEIGEKIVAGLNFTTNNYYRSADYEEGLPCDYCSDSKMDTIFLDGILYFKCKLRKKTILDK